MKFSEMINTVICGDCLTVMQDIPDKSIDLVLTDPPYDIVINKRGYGTGFYKKTNHLANIDESFGSNFKPESFLEAVKNKSKNGLLVWHSQRLIHRYLNFAEENNFKWDLMFWHKANSCPNHFGHLMVDTEYCIRMYRGGAVFNNEYDYNNYKKYWIENVQPNNGHPTPKPIDMIKNQIQIFSKPNDLICDPFLGSGTTAVAAKELGRRFIGIEISQKYVDICNKRLSQEMIFK